MFSVQKRNGEVVAFQLSKITDALRKAFVASGHNHTQDILELLSLKVTADFNHKIKDNLIQVEDIQDSAEIVLSASGYHDVAKAFILYRKQREKMRKMQGAYDTRGYKALCCEILRQAVKDWRSVIHKIVKPSAANFDEQVDNKRRRLNELRRFFKSSWCACLCDFVDVASGEQMLKKLESEYDLSLVKRQIDADKGVEIMENRINQRYGSETETPAERIIRLYRSGMSHVDIAQRGFDLADVRRVISEATRVDETLYQVHREGRV